MSKLTVRERVENWLKKNSKLINKTGFEREALLTKGVIQKFVNYDKKLNDTDIRKIYKLIKKISNINKL